MIDHGQVYPSMYSFYLCGVWLLRNNLVKNELRQEIIYGSVSGGGSMLSLPAALGYLDRASVSAVFILIGTYPTGRDRD